MVNRNMSKKFKKQIGYIGVIKRHQIQKTYMYELIDTR